MLNFVECFLPIKEDHRPWETRPFCKLLYSPYHEHCVRRTFAFCRVAPALVARFFFVCACIFFHQYESCPLHLSSSWARFVVLVAVGVSGSVVFVAVLVACRRVFVVVGVVT